MSTSTSSLEPPEWHEWRAARRRSLGEEYGWLSLTGLHWITGAVLPGIPGQWSIDGEVLRVEWGEDDGVQLLAPDGRAVPAAGTHAVQLSEPGAVHWARVGRRLLEVLRRNGRYAVRVRDPQAPTRTRLRGVPVFAHDPSWVLPVRLEAYDEPRTVVVGSAAPGVQLEATTVGTVVIPHGQREHRLVATGRTQEWHVSFSDATSGRQSAPWRAVTVQRTGTGSGVLDFNRAYNFPCAFTEFGTCPRPVDGNELPFEVRAGEKAPTSRS